MPVPALSRARRSTARSLRAAALLTLVGALAFGSFTATSVAHADDEAISGAPCGPGGDKDGRSRYTYTGQPGQVITDCYRVTNTGTVPQHVTVFATDAFNTEDGGYGLLDTAATPTQAGAWVAFAGGDRTQEFDLTPGESRALPFDVTVPDDAGPGDHAGGLVVSAVTPSDQIQVDRRVGTRLYIRVPGDLQPLLSLSSIAASYRAELNPFAGTVPVTVTIENTGNIALAGTLTLGVRTLLGIEATEKKLVTVDEFLPGSTRTVTVEVAPVGQWLYLNPYVSLYPRQDPAAPSQVAANWQIDRDAVVWAPPWYLIALIVVVGAVWWILWRRRLVDERRAAQWIAFTEAEAARKAAEDARRAPAGG